MPSTRPLRGVILIVDAHAEELTRDARKEK